MPVGSQISVPTKKIMQNKTEVEIAEIYEKSINLPLRKPSKLSLLCAVGLVGAGKTTVIKPLAKKLGFVRVSGDKLRKLLKENGYGYEKLYEMVTAIIKKLLENGYSVAIDADCASEHNRTFIREAETKGIFPLWVHVNPPEEFIITKLKNFKHTWLFKNAHEAIDNYYARKPLHENLTMPFVYVFDTSKNDLANQITEAARIIKSELGKSP